MESEWKRVEAENKIRALRMTKLQKSVCHACGEESRVYSDKANQLGLVEKRWVCDRCGATNTISEPEYSHGQLIKLEQPWSTDLQTMFLLNELDLASIDEKPDTLVILPQYSGYFRVTVDNENHPFVTLTKAGEGKLQMILGNEK